VKWLALILALLPAPALAQAYQCLPPQRIEPLRPITPDGPARRVPVYCRTDKNSMQCSGANGRFGFVLHGLWPEARAGAPPQWCSVTPRPSPEVIRRNLCMTPAPWLLEHEWAKHGSCMAKTPEAYLRRASALWQPLRWPDADRLSRQEKLTVGDLRRAFVLANRGWKPEQVGVALSRTGWLLEFRLCYDRRFQPQDCPRGSWGPPDSAPLKIWRGL
jgi:ribonuclease T2